MTFTQIVCSTLACTTFPVLAAAPQSPLAPVKRQPTPEAVIAEHFEALNRCDLDRLIAQYPDDAQINMPGGRIVKGRQDIAGEFVALCKDTAQGGLRGIQFRIEQNARIGDVFVTQWVATASFLLEPYRGSDAYITKDGLMQAMVTTFNGADLKRKP